MREYNQTTYARYYFTDEQIYDMCKNDVDNLILLSLRNDISIKDTAQKLINTKYFSEMFCFKIINDIIIEHPEFNYLLVADELNLL